MLSRSYETTTAAFQPTDRVRADARFALVATDPPGKRCLHLDRHCPARHVIDIALHSRIDPHYALIAVAVILITCTTPEIY